MTGFQAKRLNDHIRKLRVESGLKPRGDIGWKKIPSREGKYLNLYRRYVEGFFRQPSLSFFSIIVDTHCYPIDSKTYFHGMKDAGIDGFSFQLIRSHLIPRISEDEVVRLKFDRRSRPPELGLRKIGKRIRQCASKTYPDNPPSFRLSSVQGGRHPLIHVADLLLGSITASLNSKIRSNGKLAILNLIKQKLGRNPSDKTKPWEQKFNVWYFKPKSELTNSCGEETQ